MRQAILLRRLLPQMPTAYFLPETRELKLRTAGRMLLAGHRRGGVCAAPAHGTIKTWTAALISRLLAGSTMA